MKTSSRNIALLIITALLTMCLAGCRDKALNARLDTCDSLLVASPGEAYGRLSAMLLIDRIRHPEHPCRWISVKSTPVWGGSTR